MADFTVLPQEPKIEYDWSKPSKAVIANDASGNGVVLWYVGGHVDTMISDAGITGLDLLGLDDAPEGISIWEGKIKSVHYNTPDANEYDTWLEGTFRKPTDEEWESIRQGLCPWDNDEWLKKPEPATTP